MEPKTLAAVPDDELLHRLAELLRRSRRVESEIVEHMAEVDGRRLFAREASPSMFAYCTDVLHLSEAEAYLRITVARVSRKHPMLLRFLADGRLHLTGIALLAPHLTAQNRDALLARAVHKSKRKIEELVAEIAPQPDIPGRMKRLPQRIELQQPASPFAGDGGQRADFGKARGLEWPTTQAIDRSVAGRLRVAGGPNAAGGPQLRPDGVAPAAVGIVSQGVTARPPTVEALAPGRYRVQFTASTALRDKLERLRALLQPTVPDADLATVIELAVAEKLERLEARRFAQSSRPRKQLSDTDTTPHSRHVPAAIRRAVRERDGRQCGFVSKGGRRCSEGDRLEYHHRHSFGLGGDHSPKNVVLLCRTHNAWLAEQDYGRSAIARHRSAMQATKPSTAVADAPSPHRRRRTVMVTDA